MKEKEIDFVIKGMKPDIDMAQSNSEYSFQNTNIRLTSFRDSNTFAIDTGVGYDYGSNGCEGKIIGLIQIEFGKALVFTKDTQYDRIYIIENERESTLLFEGDLNFKEESFFEGVSVYENKDLYKVYWVDGVNPLRVVRVDNYKNTTYKASDFEINYKLTYNEKLDIKKKFADGSFHSGTVQYFFTYFDRFGKESTIFKSSSLYYSTPESNRAGSPEEVCTNVFEILLTDLEYENVRIYSLHRTSQDTKPSAYIVADLQVKDKRIVYTDNNRDTTAVDPNLLLYLGAEFFIPKTLALKDNTLFLGNYELPKTDILTDTIQLLSSGVKEIPLSREGQLGLSQRAISFLHSNENYNIVVQWLNDWGKPVGYSSIKTLNIIDFPKIQNNIITVPTYKIKTPTPKNKTATSARLLIHYPEGNERRVITQGVVNPTIFNIRDRLSDSPYAQSSWFFRPENNSPYSIPFKHGYPIGMWKHGVFNSFNPEVELFKHPSYKDYDLINYEDYKDTTHMQMFGIDRSILTLNSPEVDENLVISSEGTSLNLIGLCNISEGYFGYNTNLSDIDEFETTRGDYKLGFPYALGSFPTGLTKGHSPLYTLGSAFNRVGNVEGHKDKPTKNLLKTKSFYSYKIGSTNYNSITSLSIKDIIKVDTSEERMYKLDGKFYKGTINTVVPNDLSNPDTDQNFGIRKDAFDMGIVNGNLFEIGATERDSSIYWNTKAVPITYKSTKHLAFKLDSTQLSPILGYVSTDPTALKRINANSGTIPYSEFQSYVSLLRSLILTPLFIFDANIKYSKDGKTEEIYNAFTIKYTKLYKFSPTFLKDNIKNVIEEYLISSGYVKKQIQNNLLSFSSSEKIFAFEDLADGTFNLFIPNEVPSKLDEGITLELISRYNSNSSSPSSEYGYNYPQTNYKLKPFLGGTDSYLFIANLYRNNIPVVNKDCLWTVASDPVYFGDSKEVEIEILGGDTYFQIYDCVKTLPLKDTDYNQVTEALSVGLETRINIYGRYDKNVDTYRYHNVNEDNFNKLNSVYSQKDNFINYRIIDDWKLKKTFNTQITWSKAKSNNELIDSFTHFSLASTLDLDGSCGELNKLLSFKDNLFFFQDSGFGVVPFNSRVQIPVSDGVPIEITNGYKVDGYKYISKEVGCSQKQTITHSLDYIYFYSNILDELYQYGNGLVSLGVTHGMRSLLRGFFNKPLNAVYHSDHRVYFNVLTSDNKERQLAFNEMLNSFESFYTFPFFTYNFDTKDNFVFFNNTHYITIRKEPSLYPPLNYTYLPWEVEYKVNPNLQQTDRIYTNAEFTLGNTQIKEMENLFGVYIENDYQKGWFDRPSPSDIRKRLQIYNINLPRDSKNKFNRIRSPWIKIKLKGVFEEKLSRPIIRNFKVKYFE